MLLILKHLRKVLKLQKDKEGTEENPVMKEKVARERQIHIHISEIKENLIRYLLPPCTHPHSTRKPPSSHSFSEARKSLDHLLKFCFLYNSFSLLCKNKFKNFGYSIVILKFFLPYRHIINFFRMLKSNKLFKVQTRA